MAHDLSPRLIDLALEPAFELGGLEVRPATLEVLAGERREQLEPRIMQVLVALAHRRGEVVSRDELIATCWGGRVVGEDSINRCIFQLRKLAERLGGFEIATVPRVGFRLSEARDGGPAGRAAQPRLWRWIAAAVSLVIVAAAVATLAWQAAGRHRLEAAPRIAIRTFDVIGDDAESQAFARQLADQVAGVVGENAVGFSLPRAAAGQNVGGADIVLSGVVAREGRTWRVRAYLEDTRAKAALWSAQFEQPVGSESLLRDEVAVAVTETLFDVREALRGRDPPTDPATLALYLKGVAAIRNPQSFAESEATRALEQVVSRAPNFAEGHGSLAVALVQSSVVNPYSDRPDLLRRARQEASRGQQLDPSLGPGFGALYRLIRLETPDDLMAAQAQLQRGLSRAPDFPFLNMDECRFLVEVGRARDGLPFCQRALALRPLGAPLGYSHGHALYVMGESELAVRAMERYLRFHPNHRNTRRLRFEIASFSGPPEGANAILQGPSAPELTDEGRAALEAFLAARKAGTPTDAARAVAAMRTAAKAGRLDPRYLVIGAAVLGDVDGAFAALDDRSLSYSADLGYLFEPGTAAMRRDPRFWPIAARLGLVRYWRATGRWPDFCSDPGLPQDCKTAAARVAG